MATYRNSYSNYYSDKTGNHSPVGTILPVFADVNNLASKNLSIHIHNIYIVMVKNLKFVTIQNYTVLYRIPMVVLHQLINTSKSTWWTKKIIYLKQ